MTRTLSTRLREAEQIGFPTEADYSRLLDLASDMEDEIDRLRDMVQVESTRRTELQLMVWARGFH